MKKLFMVTLAAVLIISAAGCAKKTAQQFYLNHNTYKQEDFLN